LKFKKGDFIVTFFLLSFIYALSLSILLFFRSKISIRNRRIYSTDLIFIFLLEKIFMAFGQDLSKAI